MSSSSTTIPHPYATIPGSDRKVIQIFICPKVEEDFRRRISGGTKGTMSVLGATFFAKLYAAWTDAGYPITYEPENETRLQQLLERLNFDTKPDSSTKRPARRKSPTT